MKKYLDWGFDYLFDYLFEFEEAVWGLFSLIERGWHGGMLV